MRAFLSHSSKDKDFVGKVFGELTATRAHYDIETFDDRHRSADEIEKALGSSTVFVLFASEESIKAPWVLGEIDLAKHLHASGKIKRNLVYLLGSATRDSLPAWLQQFIVSRVPSPRFVSAKIQPRTGSGSLPVSSCGE